MGSLPFKICGLLTSFTRRWARTPCLFVLGLALVSPLTTPCSANQSMVDDVKDAFPTPPLIRKQVRFWERVFQIVPSTTAIIHDSHHPDVIIDLIDFKKLAQCKSCPKTNTRKKRDEIAEQFLSRYQEGLNSFAQWGEKSRLRSAIEQRIYDVYSRDPANLAALLKGRARIRVQGGLADEFAAAAARAAPLIPLMEQIFIDHGVPSMISRVAFVESMFNPRAYSKVGASGLWQFMPETARRFMLVNDWVDERHAPLKATRAAARLFRQNYQELGSWPLAITAYNHGTLGIRKAIQKVGSGEIQSIVTRYESPSFGFASRNFYAEFLAAHRTFEQLRRSGALKGAQTTAEVPETDTVKLPVPISIAQIVAHTGLSHDQLHRLNPCLRPLLFSTHRHQPLPKGYELSLPKSASKRLVLGLLPPSSSLKSPSRRL